MSSCKNLLIIFTKNLQKGTVKTRLAKTIGNDDALIVYKKLIAYTQTVTKDLGCDKSVYYSNKIEENDSWNTSVYSKRQQKGTHLGERMENAFSDAFSAGYEKVLIIGTDNFEIRTSHIENAFDDLDKNDFVFGPAYDGGYYLLGMKKLNKKLFENKKWSTDSVLSDSILDIENSKFNLLEKLNDIDVFEDLKIHKELVEIISEQNK